MLGLVSIVRKQMALKMQNIIYKKEQKSSYTLLYRSVSLLENGLLPYLLAFFSKCYEWAVIFVNIMLRWKFDRLDTDSTLWNIPICIPLVGLRKYDHFYGGMQCVMLPIHPKSLALYSKMHILFWQACIWLVCPRPDKYCDTSVLIFIEEIAFKAFHSYKFLQAHILVMTMKLVVRNVWLFFWH